MIRVVPLKWYQKFAIYFLITFSKSIFLNWGLFLPFHDLLDLNI